MAVSVNNDRDEPVYSCGREKALILTLEWQNAIILLTGGGCL